jgi:hypothetical protein
MKVIYQGKSLAHYNQIALIDEEDKDSYPQWETSIEPAVFGPKGIAVGTVPDAWIEITISQRSCQEEKPACPIHVGSAVIEVGSKGLLVGNILSATFEVIPWNSGKTRVEVYTNGLENTATQVDFVVEPI